MISILNTGFKYLKWFYGWEDLSLGKRSSPSVESRVSSVATKLIMPIALMEQLPDSFFHKIILPFLHPKDWNSLGRSSSLMSRFLNHERFNGVWPELYHMFEQRYPKVRNLDKLLGIPECVESNETKSIKRFVYILARAGLIAEISEDGGATMVTIPADWSIKDLEKMSQAAVVAGVSSAEIRYRDPAYRNILLQNPMKKTQTIILSDMVIKNSRNKSVTDHKKLLKKSGLEEEFPDLLMTLTTIVLTEILTQGEESIYSSISESIRTYTRTKQTTEDGYHLCVGCEPSYVNVDAYFQIGHLGVGAQLKF